MSTTLLQLRTLVYNFLNEDTDSVVGEVGSNNANSPAQTTDATITQEINFGYDLLSKTCIALLDSGTLSYALNSKFVQLSTFTMSSGGTLFAPIDISWNGTDLQKMDQAYDTLNFGMNTPSGTPKYWVPWGTYGLRLTPPPSATQAVTVFGAVTPPPLSANGDLVYGIPDSETLYIAYYAAYMIASKNIESPNLQLKIMPWKNEFDAASLRMYAQLKAFSPSLAIKYFSPPSALPAPQQMVSS